MFKHRVIVDKFDFLREMKVKIYIHISRFAVQPAEYIYPRNCPIEL